MITAWRRMKRCRRSRAGLAALCLLAYAPPILGLLIGWWPFGEDALAYFAPLRGWAGDQLRNGTVPLWNPYLFFGQPFAANVQSALWYPPNLVYWLLPERFALLLDALAHTVWLAWGGFALARAFGLRRTPSFLAATLLALGGAVAARVYAGQLIWLGAFSHVPWLLNSGLAYLRSGVRREAVTAGLWMGLIILAGHPPTALLAGLLCCALTFLWIVTRKRGQTWLPRGWGWATVAFTGVALLLSGAVWLPFRELSRLAEHGGQLSFADATILSGTWKSFVRLIAPDWFGGNRGLQWSQMCCSHEEAASIGVWPFVLALSSVGLAGSTLSRKYARAGTKAVAVRWLWLALPFIALMALGANTPFYGWLFSAVPPLRLVRVPARWILLWAFAAPFLAAAVWQRAFVERDERLIRLVTTLVRAAALVFGLLVAWVLLSPDAVWQAAAARFTHSTPGMKGAEIAANFRRVALLESGMVFLLAGLAGSLLARWLGAENGPARGRYARLLIGFACLECLLGFWRGAKLVSPKDQAEAFWPPQVAARYRPGERWATSIFWQGINQAMPAGVPLANGYDPLGTKTYFAFAGAAEGRTFWETVYQPKRRSPLWRVAGTTHTLAQKPDALDGETPYPDTRGWKLETATGPWELWNHREPTWPRTYLAAEVWKTQEPLPLLDRLARRGGGAWPVVLAPADLPQLPQELRFGSAVLPPGEVRITHETPNRVTLQTQSSREAALVLADANFPGWHAYVNGRATPLVTANGVFRAAAVPAGTATTDMVYEPQSVRLGLFLTLCAVGLMSFLAQARPRTGRLENEDESNSSA